MRGITLAVVTAGALVGAGCGPGGGTGTPDAGGPYDCDAEHPTVTTQQVFDTLVEGQITGNCKSCHVSTLPDTSTGGMHLDDVSMLEAVIGKDSAYGEIKIVDANNPANSTMYLKVLGGSPDHRGPDGEFVGGLMPQSGPELSDEHKELIKDWICSQGE